MSKIDSRTVSDVGVIQDTKTLTGSINIVNDSRYIEGTNTLFKSEIRLGDWIYDPTNVKIYQVQGILENTKLWITELATADYNDSFIASVNNPNSITYTNIGTSNVLVNGQVLKVGETQNYNFNVNLPAILYNATGGLLRIDLIYGL